MIIYTYMLIIKQEKKITIVYEINVLQILPTEM